MINQQKILSKESVTSLFYANNFAQNQKHKYINGDDLFLGIHHYIKTSNYNDIFLAITGIKENSIQEITSKNNIQNVSTTTKSNDVYLSFTKKIYTQIKEYVNTNDTKISIIDLLSISLINLSSRFKKQLISNNISIDNLINNCENIANNPIVIKQGLFAFLDILDKLFKKLHLSPKNIEIMDIKTFDELGQINMLLDEVDKEIMDKNESSIGDSTTKTTKKEEKKMTIEYFGTDLTKEVKDHLIDPIIGRNNEINQIIYTLLRKNKNNPLLIGEAGVGKTAVVEGLAQKIVAGDVPEKLKNKKIFMIDMGTIVAGTKYRGEFESRMKAILEEATDPLNNIILFIDEIHTIIGAGGQENNDAAQMIKPLLSRGKIKLIGATTFNEFQKHIEKDAALKRRFQEVIVNEPNNQDTKQILLGLQQTYEDFHGVHIEEGCFDYAINLSKRYILNKHLPDKALDLIDEACAKKSTMTGKLENDEDYKKQEEAIQNIQKKIEVAIEKQDYFGAAALKEQEENIKKEMLLMRTQKNIPTHLRPSIKREDIGVVLAEKLGIPSNIVNESEIDKLRRLDFILKTHIVGQNEAVESIVKTLTRSRLSVVQKTKPMGSFLFLGPSGVGKTFLAKLIAKEYFGDEQALIRFDMSEFMEKYSVSKLIGSPAGYVGYDEGGNLTEAIRRKPYSVILFDEIEKASPDVLNILLQILDEGLLKDSKGRIVDFKSTIIIMTSNIGSDEFSKKQTKIGFSAGGTATEIDEQHFQDIKTRVLEELKNYLSPELINRIDYKIVFRHLNKSMLKDIMKIRLNEFLAAWKDQQDVKIPKYNDKKIQEMVDKIYDPQYGARPIERYIQDVIEPEIIKHLLQKK
ncbi:MAG: ATP-dependent Clp protease ATP-binding subunit [Candidatus Absconditabacteria bacterium]|nr:ATP-dependent Clp protease ATP-binding subunit [Candidatus Absconditabacteria bacterium]